MNFTRIILLLLIGVNTWAQSYVHDPALDDIRGGVANVDASINGYFQQNGRWLTTNDVEYYGHWAETNQFQTMQNITNIAGTNQVYWTKFYSNQFNYTMVYTQGGSGHYTGSTSNAGNINLGTFNGASFSMNIAVVTGSLLDQTGAVIRLVIVSIMWFMIFMWSKDLIDKHVSDAMNQRQIEGSKVSIFGWSASSFTGLIFAAIVTSVLFAVVSYASVHTILNTAFANSGYFQTWLQTAGAIPGWDIATCFLPVNEILSAFSTYFMFRYIFIFPIFAGVRAVILWLAA